MLFLNVVMAFLMFSVALDVRISDFRRVLQYPRAVFAGLLSQYVLFPLLTLGMIWVFRPPTSVALGMVLVSMCPSGNMTNFLAHFARAHVALSITLNAVIILSASVITPAGFLFWGKMTPGAAGMIRTFDISFAEMTRLILLLIVAPLAAGMWMTARLPAFTARIRVWMQRLSLLAFFGILVGALAGNLSNLAEYLRFVFVIVALHNALALAGGYGVGAAFGLSKQDRRTLSIESGVHNTALGLVLIFQFFNGLGGMVLIAAWWGIWDLITGIALAYYWRKRP